MEGRMQSKKYFFAGASVLGLAFILFLTSCDSIGAGITSSYTTINWETNAEGFKRFSTNDPRYHDYYFWKNYTNTPGEDIYEIEIKKISGAAEYGYGMVFCFNSSSMYAVFITINGSYTKIAKFTNNRNTVTPLTTYNDNNYDSSTVWSNNPHPYLNTGYGALNTIKIVKVGNSFTLYFNDDQNPTPVDTFIDPDSPLTGKALGGIVFVGDSTDEDFPGTPVDVRMKIK